MRVKGVLYFLTQQISSGNFQENQLKLKKDLRINQPSMYMPSSRHCLNSVIFQAMSLLRELSKLTDRYIVILLGSHMSCKTYTRNLETRYIEHTVVGNKIVVIKTIVTSS